MMSIVFTILKILGIVLLVLLGIVLALILLVLFVPLRYRLDVHRDLKEAEEKPVVAVVRATWLFRLLTVKFAYPDAAYVLMKVFGITVYRSDQEKEKKSETKKEKQAEEAEKETGKEAETEAEKKAEKEAEKKAKKEAVEEAEEKKETDEKAALSQQPQEALLEDKWDELIPDAPDAPEEPHTEDKSESSEVEPKFLDFIKKLWEKIKNIKYTISQIYGKINHIIKNIKYYVRVLQSDTFKNAFSLCSKQIFYLLKSIRPRKVKGNLLIGTNDPASTGQILGIYGMLYPILGNHIEVTPDFERQVIEGELLVKGRITVFKALKVALTVFFNKDIRRVIKLLKREAK